jgi:hypothetical protein
MPGSGAAEPVAVCEIAVPLGPHSNAADKIATAEGAAKLDDNLMTCAPVRDGNAVPVSARYHNFRIGPARVEKISADRVKQCPSSGTKRKTSTRDRYFAL